MLHRRNEFQDRYDRFLRELRGAITSGELQPGEFILPENTLGEVYGLSRVSIRKGLAELVSEGLIEKIAGKGNRVRMPEGQIVKEIIRLGWFSNSYEIDIVRRIISRFEAQHPFVTVQLELLPEEDYAGTLNRLIEQDQGPDVFMVSDFHIRDWMDKGDTGLLTGYAPPSLSPERDSYPAVFRMFTHEGRLLAAPLLFSPVMICYNRTLFRESGIREGEKLGTWQDLVRVASQCTKETSSNGMVGQYGFCFSGSANRWPVFLLQNGGGIMAADRSRSTFSSESNVEALEFCTELIYRHQVSPIYSHGSNTLAEHLFMKQRVAMILTTYYFMNEFRNHPIDWDVLPVPENQTQATLLLGGALALNSKSEKRKVAESLIDFFSGEEAQTLLKQYGCTIPMLKRVAEDDGLLQPSIHPPHYNYFIDVMPYAYNLRELHLTQDEIRVLLDELHLLWANMEKPQDACRRIEQLLNSRLMSKAVER